MSLFPRTVCVFCGSRPGVSSTWLAAASALGQGLAERGIDLVYGGGSVGLMGASAAAAMAHGGKVVGIIPRDLENREKGKRDLTELHVVESMHERKLMMAQRSDAFIVLPGGLGTLDEMFESLTWRQLRFHNKPIILADIEGYWQPLLDLLQLIVDKGFADTEHLSLLTIVPSVDDIFEALASTGKHDTAFETAKV
ncbi:MAG: TIGR00730 family Rossman fold protein [Rhodospirillaceae bacterium]|nr:TIGR00730 family Rossman fold protein [Rhodospirillaceae bacterium]